jgi:hypothetical protein
MLVFLIAAGIFIYFLPTIMTKRDRLGMFTFNLLTGWSGLGWVGCVIVCLWVRAQVILEKERWEDGVRDLQQN